MSCARYDRDTDAALFQSGRIGRIGRRPASKTFLAIDEGAGDRKRQEGLAERVVQMHQFAGTGPQQRRVCHRPAIGKPDKAHVAHLVQKFGKARVQKLGKVVADHPARGHTATRHKVALGHQQTPDTAWMVQRETDPDRPAHRMAQKIDARQAEMVEHPCDAGGMIGKHTAEARGMVRRAGPKGIDQHKAPVRETLVPDQSLEVWPDGHRKPRKHDHGPPRTMLGPADRRLVLRKNQFTHRRPQGQGQAACSTGTPSHSLSRQYRTLV